MTMENQIISPHSSTANLAMHKNSHTISKTKPKIRIIHIFAPEIIKTDAANFRELVQRLTGKPTMADSNGCEGTAKTRERVSSRKKEARILSSSSKKMERAGFRAEFRERVKEEEEEEEIWMGADSGGGFLGGFAEFDGFMQEINQFPFLETQMQDAYQECQIV